jgi:hypothetical protein
MSIPSTRPPRRALIALAALAAPVALLATPAAPASAREECYYSGAYRYCYTVVEDRTLSAPNRDVDIGV